MGKYADMIEKIINDSHAHLTAKQIYIQMRKNGSKVAMATVYNNLYSLCEDGKIRKLIIEGEPDHYDRTLRHDHLICRKCGKIHDVRLDDLTKTLEKQLGISIDSYDLRVSYLCEDCRKAEKD